MDVHTRPESGSICRSSVWNSARTSSAGHPTVLFREPFSNNILDFPSMPFFTICEHHLLDSAAFPLPSTTPFLQQVHSNLNLQVTPNLLTGDWS